MSLIMSLIVGLIVIFNVIKTQATPLSLLTRTANAQNQPLQVATPPTQGKYTQNPTPQDTGLRASTDASEKSYEPSCSLSLQLGGHCRLHFITLATQPCSDTKSLGSVSLTISWHLRPKAVRVSVSAGSLGPGGMRASGKVSANAGAGAGATTH